MVVATQERPAACVAGFGSRRADLGLAADLLRNDTILTACVVSIHNPARPPLEVARSPAPAASTCVGALHGLENAMIESKDGNTAAADEKVCPDCGQKLKRVQRPRPATGAMFVAPFQWVCTNPACERRQE